MVETDPLDPKDVTPAEWAATEEAARILREILDNNAE